MALKELRHVIAVAAGLRNFNPSSIWAIVGEISGPEGADTILEGFAGLRGCLRHRAEGGIRFFTEEDEPPRPTW